MNRSQGLTVVLLAGVVACGGTEPEDVFELTEEQAVAMFTAMKGLEIAREANGSFVVQCPDGGEAELVGGVEVTQYPVATVVDRDYTVTPRDCVVDTGDGKRFTLAGETGFRNMLRITINFWFFPISGGRLVMREAIGVEVEASEVEVDGVRKAFLVAEAAAACLDRLDPAVDAFGGSVGRT